MFRVLALCGSTAIRARCLLRSWTVASSPHSSSHCNTARPVVYRRQLVQGLSAASTARTPQIAARASATMAAEQGITYLCALSFVSFLGCFTSIEDSCMPSLYMQS